jgi:WD40 repeat protein
MKKLLVILFSAACLTAAAQNVEIFPQTVKQIWGNSAEYGSDGKTIISGSPDNTVKIWDAKSGKLLRTLAGHEAIVAHTGYSPNGLYIVSVSWDQTARIWDAKSGRELHRFTNILSGMQRSQTVAFSPDSRCVTAISRGVIKVWDIESGRELQTFQAGDVSSLIYSPDGSFIVGGFSDSFKVWDAETGQEVRSFPSAGVMSLGYSPDGRRLAIAAGLEVKIWDAVNWREIRTLKRNEMGILTSLAYSPDGKYIAASSYMKTITIWDAAGGRELRKIMTPEIVLSVDYSSNGKHIAVTYVDGTLRLLDAETGQEIARYVSFDDGEWICITPDGYYNASPKGDTHLNALVDDEVYSIDQFRHIFYQPAVIQARLNGENIPGTVVFAPPEIVIREEDANRGINVGNTNTGISSRQYRLSTVITDKNQPIRSIKILINGRRIGEDELNTVTGSRGVTVQGAELTVTGDGDGRNMEFSFSVGLDAGRNLIEVIAANGHAEARKSIEVSYQPRTGEVIGLPNLWLLAIGVNNYENENIPDLNYCVNDAREIINVFKKQEGKRYAKVNTLLIADGTPLSPTAENIRENLGFLFGAGSRDVVLLFLAGHGVSDTEGVFFFLPSDTGFSLDGAIDKNRAIGTADIFSVLNASGNRLVFIDACHSGGLSSKTNGVDNDRLVRSLMESNAFVFTSSRGNELSQERKDFRHGVFTYGIIQGLAGLPESQIKGSISMMQLSGYVSKVVKEITDDQQHPSPYTLGFDDFTIAQTE